MPPVESQRSLWEDIAAHAVEWIGGTLIDCEVGEQRTRIRGVVWRDNRFFEVVGEDFNCGGSQDVLGVVGPSRFGRGIELCGYAGHEWHMLKPEQAS